MAENPIQNIHEYLAEFEDIPGTRVYTAQRARKGYWINQFAMSPYDNWVSLAWGGALLITFSVLLLNVLSRTLFKQQIPG